MCSPTTYLLCQIVSLSYYCSMVFHEPCDLILQALLSCCHHLLLLLLMGTCLAPHALQLLLGRVKLLLAAMEKLEAEKSSSYQHKNPL
jgi:hypothetical protein